MHAYGRVTCNVIDVNGGNEYEQNIGVGVIFISKNGIVDTTTNEIVSKFVRLHKLPHPPARILFYSYVKNQEQRFFFGNN